MLNMTSDTFRQRHILVIGDIVLDSYIYGDVERINPEAPVPVMRVIREECKLGGTANVAANIRSLGGSCTLIGQVGKDDAGNKLKCLIDNAGITSFLIERGGIPTIIKTRIIARNQQVIRVDREEPKVLENGHVDDIIRYLRSAKYDLIVVSDYAKGVVCERLFDFLKSLGTRIVVDPKPSNKCMYHGIYAITPNIRESLEMCSETDIVKRGHKIVEDLGCNVIITRGEDGASLYTTDKTHHYIPAKKREVFDVVGAGDTFVAALSLAISSGMDLPMACSVANHASGIAVEKVGTSVVTIGELIDSIGDKIQKVKQIGELKPTIDELRKRGSKIVFTNGCFDILHVGHAKLLKEAKSHGDVLVLGLNTDESIKALKGPGRPINNQNDRAEILSHIPYVDYIVFFGDRTPCELISELKPDVHVKGGDYDPYDYDRMPEAKIVHGYGGKVVTIDYVDGKSSTKSIKMLKMLGDIG